MAAAKEANGGRKIAVDTSTMSPSLDTRETRAFAFEIKFLLDATVADRVRQWARARLGADPHGRGPSHDEYVTSSLYFDTAGLDVLRQHGSYGRMKFRVRRYGDAAEIHLERKLRNARMLIKRRTTVDATDLGLLAATELPEQHPGRWFHRRVQLRGLRPVCQVTYVRTARVVEGAYGPIRLTIDDAMRATVASRLAFNEAAGTPVLSGHQILELKYRFAMPAIFKQLVEEFALAPTAVSKYRLSAAALLPKFASRPHAPAPLPEVSRGLVLAGR